MRDTDSREGSWTRCRVVTNGSTTSRKKVLRSHASPLSSTLFIIFFFFFLEKLRNRCWLRIKDLSKQTSLEKRTGGPLGWGAPSAGMFEQPLEDTFHEQEDQSPGRKGVVGALPRFPTPSPFPSTRALWSNHLQARHLGKCDVLTTEQLGSGWHGVPAVSHTWVPIRAAPVQACALETKHASPPPGSVAPPQVLLSALCPHLAHPTRPPHSQHPLSSEPPPAAPHPSGPRWLFCKPRCSVSSSSPWLPVFAGRPGALCRREPSCCFWG